MLKKLIGLLLLGLIVSVAVVWLLAEPPQEESTLPVAIKIEELPREALLYFVAPEGSYLVSEIQQIAGCDDDRDCVRNLFTKLAAGSQGSLAPVLSPQVKVLSVELRDELAVVDFNQAFIHAHPGGSLSELLTVYALVNSLAVNFPYLKQLQILVEGASVETLKGHVRLVRPVIADFSYSRPPQTGAPAHE